MKIAFFIPPVLFLASLVQPLNHGASQQYNFKRLHARKEIKIPDILGYTTLKCDLHMHTVFSDGIVWPTYRIDEAWEEGLDAIAISDHIENQPVKKYITGDHNVPYEIALEEALEKNILLIHAGEITRPMPPGHLNAIFADDINLLDVADYNDALISAKNQGAFIIWNHPCWKAQQRDTCIWMQIHQDLFEKGLINGIEVYNDSEFYPEALGWCLEKNMPVISCSDIHGIVSHAHDLENGHRPMTLIFARERSLSSIREALFDNRVLAFFDGKLAGKKEFLEAVFMASVSITPSGSKRSLENEIYEIRNCSSIQFEIETMSGIKLVLPAETMILCFLDENEYNDIKVTNLYAGSDSPLEIKSLFR